MTASHAPSSATARRLSPGLIALLGIVIGGLGIAAIVLAIDSDTTLDSLGVRTDEFQERWNDTMDQLGAEHRLSGLSWEPDDPIGLEVAAETVADWALLEIYRDEADWVTAVVLVAQPGAEPGGTSFAHLGTASIAAALQLDRAAAERTFADLGGDDPGAAAIDERVERDGIAINLQRDGGTWQLRITAANASA